MFCGFLEEAFESSHPKVKAAKTTTTRMCGRLSEEGFELSHHPKMKVKATNQADFPKLHDLRPHVADLIKKQGIYGRLSEEAFESSHPLARRSGLV
jgi:hypothetical protein